MAQPNLRRVNADTEVSKVVFRGSTFPESQLLEVIATQAPTFLDRHTPAFANRFLFREQRRFLFSPFEVRRDVIRLKRFYQRNGFLDPTILAQYNFNEAQNRITVLFNISEGRPLVFQDITFVDLNDQEIFHKLPKTVQQGWIPFRQPFIEELTQQFSELKLAQFREKTTQWLKDQGYAFLRLQDMLAVDTTANMLDIKFRIDLGPKCRFGKIRIDGLNRMDDATIRKMLTFQEGDPFSFTALEASKKALMESSQFRIALFEVPSQPKDEEVEVLFKVRESNLRSVSGQIGLSSDTGIRLEGRWEHRNFVGGARNLAASLVVQPGDSLSLFRIFPTETKYRGSVAFRQPNFLTRKLSFLVQPFIEYSDDYISRPQNAYGSDVSLLYRFNALQNLTLAGTVARVNADAATQTQNDRYNQSAVSLSGIFGDVDNILYRTRGWLVKPSVTLSGRAPFIKSNPRIFLSDLNYLRTSLESTMYLQPLVNYAKLPRFMQRASLNVRLMIGQMWTSDSVFTAQNPDTILQDRYARLLFYAGGDRDIRGWRNQYLGPRDVDGLPSGGLAKLAGNIEAQIPFPQLPSLRLVSFLDFGNVWQDALHFSPQDLRYGAGGGFRFLMAGFTAGLDVGVKLNPSYDDIHKPDGTRCYWYDVLGSCAPVAIHFQLGQTF